MKLILVSVAPRGQAQDSQVRWCDMHAPKIMQSTLAGGETFRPTVLPMCN